LKMKFMNHGHRRRRGKSKTMENIFNKMIVQHFFSLGKNVDVEVHEAFRIPKLP
jgi:hypothetical protein